MQGLDSFIGDDDGSGVEVVTNAGRAYIQGYRLQKDLPTTTVVPKSVATKAVRGEQKTYDVDSRRYALNSTPLRATHQVEAIVAIVSPTSPEARWAAARTSCSPTRWWTSSR